MADSLADLLGCDGDYDFDDDLYPGIAPKPKSASPREEWIVDLDTGDNVRLATFVEIAEADLSEKRTSSRLITIGSMTYGVLPKSPLKKPSVTITYPQPELFKPVIDSMPEGSVLVAGRGGFRTLVQCEGCEKLMHERSDGSLACSAVCLQAAQRKERERIAAEKHEASDKVYRSCRHLDRTPSALTTQPDSKLDEAIRSENLAPATQEKKGGRRELPPLNPAAMVGMRRY